MKNKNTAQEIWDALDSAEKRRIRQATAEWVERIEMTEGNPHDLIGFERPDPRFWNPSKGWTIDPR